MDGKQWIRKSALENAIDFAPSESATIPFASHAIIALPTLFDATFVSFRFSREEASAGIIDRSFPFPR